MLRCSTAHLVFAALLSPCVVNGQAPTQPATTEAPAPGPRPPAPFSSPRPLSTVVAGIPVNYDDAQAGTYTLPDPLLLANGKPVRDAKTWNQKRRPKIVRL